MEAFETLLPVLAVACLWLYLLRCVYGSGLIGARPPCAQFTRNVQSLLPGAFNSELLFL